MSEDMVEKVADAIETAMASDDNSPSDLARAAIEAMREPTLAMAQEGAWAGHETVEASWRAMIDAALNPPPSLSTDQL